MASVIKGSRADNCHCCPVYTQFDPYSGPTIDHPNDPAEPSDPRVRILIDELAGEGTLTTETVVAGGITASVSVTSGPVGATAPGSRRLTINATSPGPGKWVAGAILWTDDPPAYDPSVGGSVSRFRARAAVRLNSELVPLVRDGNDRPELIFGPVIQQGGNTYFSFLSNAVPANDGNLTLYDDECWRTWGRNIRDGQSPHYISRTPTVAEGRYTGPPSVPDRFSDLNGETVGRPDDWLCTLDNGTAEFDTDDRPDISYDRVSRPITRFGIWVALTGERPDTETDVGTAAGSYTLDILLDDIYLDMTTWGVFKIANADLGSAPVFGTTYVDEDLTTIPAWTQTGLPIRDQNGQDEGCTGTMNNVLLVDGLVGQNIVSGGEYTEGRIGSSFATPTLTESSQITVEFTWHKIRDRDHWDSDGTAPDPVESRALRAGVWFDTLFRFDAQREGTDWDHDCGNLLWSLHEACMPDGGTRITQSFTNTWGGDDYDLPARTETSGPPSEDCGTTHNAWHRPMDGDRYTIILRRQYTDAEAAAINAQIAANIAAGGYGGTMKPPVGIVYPEARWLAWVYSHGRLALPGDVNLENWGGSIIWFPDATLAFGLIGFCGGRWSNLRIRIS